MADGAFGPQDGAGHSGSEGPPIPHEPKGSPRAVRHPDEGLGGGRSLGPGVPSSLSSPGDIAPPLTKAQLGKGQAWRTRAHLGLISRSPPSARLPAPLTATAFVNGMSPTSTHFETDKKVQSKSGAIPPGPTATKSTGSGSVGRGTQRSWNHSRRARGRRGRRGCGPSQGPGGRSAV